MALAAAIVSWPGQGQADIYRRIDRQGVAHYTNVRPANGTGWRRIVRSPRRASSRPQHAGSRRASLMRQQRYEPLLREAAGLYELPLALLRAVARVESNFKPHVVSPAGAMGVMQLMPATAASMGVHDPFDPRESIRGGARYLRVLANLFNGDVVLTVAAYNAGHRAVLRHHGVPPYHQTRRYVRRVLTHYRAYRASERPEADTSADKTSTRAQHVRRLQFPESRHSGVAPHSQ